MIQQNPSEFWGHRIFRFYLLSLFLLPLIGYFTINYLDRRPIYFYQFFIGFFFLISFLNSKKIFKNKPIFIKFLVLYVLYIWTWNIFNGYLYEKGFLKWVFANMLLYDVLLLILIYSFHYDRKFIRNVLFITKVWFILLITGQLIQTYYDPFFLVIDQWTSLPEFRPSVYTIRRPSVFSLVSDHEFGISILALFAIFLGYNMKEKTRIPWLWMCLAILYAVLTNTRYIMVGVALVLSQIFFLKERLLHKIHIFILLPIVFILSLFIVTNYFNYNLRDYYDIRLFAEGDIRNTSRYFALSTFAEFFPDKPMFGNGVHLTNDILDFIQGRSSQIHVGYLQHLVSYGIVGSIFLFGFWFSAFLFLFRRAVKTQFYGSVFAFSMLLWANVTLVTYEIFFVGIILAFVFDKYYWDEYQAEKQ